MTASISDPQYQPATQAVLQVDSTIADLGRYQFQVEAEVDCGALWPILDRHPRLPGVVVHRQGTWLGMMPRSLLVELMARSQRQGTLEGLTLGQAQRYSSQTILCVSVNTPILMAAQQALRRLQRDQSAPVVVQEENGDYSLLDAHELNIAHWQLRGIEVQVRYERAQMHMIRTEKMANLGRLVDGVAHEILDPVGFIWGNLSHIADYTQQLLTLVAAYQDQGAAFPTVAGLDREELAYLQQDLPKAIASVQAGAKRLKTLAASLQTFCHIDEVYPKPADLHDALDSMLLLINSRLNGRIRLTRTYGHLPPLVCHIGQLNQALMTLLLQLVDDLLGEVARRAVVADLASAALPQAVLLPPPEIQIVTQVLSSSEVSQPDGPPDWYSTSAGLQPDAGRRWISIQVCRNGEGWTDPQQQALLAALTSDRDQPINLALCRRMITAQGGILRWRSPRDGAAFEVLLPLV
jgi:signal transduction histidine kinase